MANVADVDQEVTAWRVVREALTVILVVVGLPLFWLLYFIAYWSDRLAGVPRRRFVRTV